MSITSQILEALPAEQSMAINNAAIYEKCTEATDKSQVSTLLAQLFSAGKICRADLGEGGNRPRYVYWRPANIENKELTETIKKMSETASTELSSADLDLLNFKNPKPAAPEKEPAKLDLPPYQTDLLYQSLLAIGTMLPECSSITIKRNDLTVEVELELDNGMSIYSVGEDLLAAQKVIDAYRLLQRYEG